MLPHVFRAKAGRLAAAPRPPRASLAGTARPVPRLAFGSHAAADTGSDGHTVLPQISRKVPHRRNARRGPRGRRAAPLERLGLLRARPQSSQGRATHSAQRLPTQPRRDRKTTGGRAFDGGGHRGVRLWPARRDPRRQRQAGSIAGLRCGRREAALVARRAFAAAPWDRDVYPGSHGSRCNRMHSQPAMRRLSGEDELRRAQDRTHRRAAGGPAQAPIAAQAGNVVRRNRWSQGLAGAPALAWHLGRAMVFSRKDACSPGPLGMRARTHPSRLHAFPAAHPAGAVRGDTGGRRRLAHAG